MKIKQKWVEKEKDQDEEGLLGKFCFIFQVRSNMGLDQVSRCGKEKEVMDLKEE